MSETKPNQNIVGSQTDAEYEIFLKQFREAQIELENKKQEQLEELRKKNGWDKFNLPLTILKPGSKVIHIEGVRLTQTVDMVPARYEYFDELWPMFIFGISYLQMKGETIKAANAIFENDSPLKALHEVGTILTNMHKGMTAIGGPTRIDVAMEICALTYNLDNENTTIIDHDVINEKKELFKKCNSGFFLTTAASLIPSLLQDLARMPETIETLTDLLATLRPSTGQTLPNASDPII